MNLLLSLLVTLVFLGTEILAVPTPAFQLSPYRIINVLMWAVTIYKIHQGDRRLRLDVKNPSIVIIGVYLFWWIWAIVSLTWAMNIANWMRAIFLLTIGISAMVFIYLWTYDISHWKQLVKNIWLAMLILVVWGYWEILTNHYFLANLSKLDKYGTFSSDPLSRIPVTVFENQNDFATMLIAYLSLTFIMIQWGKRRTEKLTYYICFLAGVYLIYRCQSRMTVLAMILLIIIKWLLNYHLDVKKPVLFKWTMIVTIAMIFLSVLIEPIRDKLSSIIYLGYGPDLSGDAVRLNLWRNGFEFLGQSFGFGVGAGNIEFWMASFGSLPTEDIVNMHNWWLEILVAYGLPVFLSYTIAYFYMIYVLYKSRPHLSEEEGVINDSLITFLIVYIFASITSANNILIEWHWIFFGLIIVYIKLIWQKISQKRNEEIS